MTTEHTSEIPDEPKFHIEDVVPLDVYEPITIVSADCQRDCHSKYGRKKELAGIALNNPGRLVVLTCARGDMADRTGGCMAVPVILEPVLDGATETPVNWKVDTKRNYNSLPVPIPRREPEYTDAVTFFSKAMAAAAKPARVRRSRHYRGY